MDDLYRENILEHYKRPHHWGELEDPDFSEEEMRAALDKLPENIPAIA